jgi:hypothetical protein
VSSQEATFQERETVPFCACILSHTSSVGEQCTFSFPCTYSLPLTKNHSIHPLVKPWHTRALRVTVLGLTVCLFVDAHSGTTGY